MRKLILSAIALFAFVAAGVASAPPVSAHPHCGPHAHWVAPYKDHHGHWVAGHCHHD